MPGLPDAKLDIVRHLVASAPDKVVDGLRTALASAAGDTALAGVRRVVEAEVAERILRNQVLEPVAPLFADPSATEALRFAPHALPLLWRGLRAVAPDEVEGAALALETYEPGVTTSEPFDLLVERLVDEIDARAQPEIVAGLEAIEAARPGAALALRACLTISPVVRRARMKLPQWIVRTSQEQSAAARIAYRDACRSGDDLGPYFFEMLAAQLAEPWTILRIVAAVMDRPAEAYLAGSELAVFATRLMDTIDLGLEGVAKFDLDGGQAAGDSAAKEVETLTLQIAELENAIELSRDGVWGARIQKQKQVLAATVETRLRELPKVQAAALPSQKVRSARGVVSEPRLHQPPDPAKIERCRSLLAFLAGVRPSANYGGFASTRAKMIEQAGETLDQYVDDVLAAVREGLAPDLDIAGGFLEAAAEFAGPIREPRAGEIIRRRSAAAFSVVAALRSGGALALG